MIPGPQRLTRNIKANGLNPHSKYESQFRYAVTGRVIKLKIRSKNLPLILRVRYM